MSFSLNSTFGNKPGTSSSGFSLTGSTSTGTGFNFSSGLNQTNSTSNIASTTTSASSTTPLGGSLTAVASNSTSGAGLTGTSGGLSSGGLTLGSTTAGSSINLGNPTATGPQATNSGLSFNLPSLNTSTASQQASLSISNNTRNPLISNNPTVSSTSTSSSITPISFKVLEDYINKWMCDLESQEKDFLNQATQLNALDKLMIENGEKIIDISNEVNRLNNEQDQIEQELNFVFSQQNDLEEAIKKLESGIEHMPILAQQPSDMNRIEMYKLLIEVDNQLKSMSIDLRDIIKRLNDSNINLNDPVVQIGKILNAHMDSLNWIEENTILIQNQVEILSKGIEDHNRDSEIYSRI